VERTVDSRGRDVFFGTYGRLRDSDRDTEDRQPELFDSRAGDCALQLDDCWGREYRRRSAYRYLVGGIDLAGKPVLDAMCGSGQTTAYLLAQGARVKGLGSAVLISRRRRLSCFVCGFLRARRAVLRSLRPSSRAIPSIAWWLSGGLHHVQPHVGVAMREIHRLLRPGGALCFVEPHSGA